MSRREVVVSSLCPAEGLVSTSKRRLDTGPLLHPAYHRIGRERGRGRRTRINPPDPNWNLPTDKIHPMLRKKISKATLVARGVFPSMIEEAFPIRLLERCARRVVNILLGQRPGRRRVVM
jgi:hypothetical protein